MEQRFSRSELRAFHLGIFTIASSIVFFCVTAMTVLKPALKSLRFEETVCKVVWKTRSEHPGESISKVAMLHHHDKECFHSGHLSNACTKVVVQYDFPFLKTESKPEKRTFSGNQQTYTTSKFGKNTGMGPVWRIRKNNIFENDQQQAILYMNDVDLLYNDQCSFHTFCTESDGAMAREIASFHDKISFDGNRFICFYDPLDLKVTLMHRKFNEWSVFHSVFWPFLLFLIGAFTTTTLYCWIAKVKTNKKQRWKNAISCA